MADNTLSILKPSVNNLSVRIFIRAAGLEFEEVDVWGQQGTDDFYGKDPSRLTPLLECEGLPRGALWESCAIMQYLCNKHGLERFYPTDPAKRAMVDSAMAYHLATLYPLVARATYPSLGFGQYAGEVGTAPAASDDMKSQAARDAAAALAGPLDVYRVFFLGDNAFIGGSSPSIADIRLAATMEFLKVIDYDFPGWATDFLARMEEALGDAYTEPAADVRGYVDYVKSQAAVAG
jgi:glutathione S-transferase